ncbi:D-glycerate dehydrogenase [Candidatus Uhrbacteria bacterium CG10_big_fil_rev_8_21_14_0_10_50_16]|uniref:D-glycerate dehydrogenase n=1 Tax=Candidatus Uhrbacteria bacterium CG10_big_fil_rev_8_21_14_0_10_50_16 TaxID=1975039 RepID=A0A2H0RM02_9BACT|nr:MAG: D-glycerate dehydrogenase [Candidatus Uhrbacteria bacterium CG10_big_fil_rev_8_21_14_0_10_50_16]
MPKRIFVTRPIPDEGLKLLKKKRYEVDVYSKDQAIPRKELLKHLKAKRYDAVLSILTDKIDEAVFKAAGDQLQVVANYAVGFNNIDLEAAKKHNVIITNTPGPEINESVAEHVIALMFALAHRVVETDDYARAGLYKGWGPQLLLGTDISGKTLGIVGMGNIGMQLAHRMHDGFNMKIVYADVAHNTEAEKKYGATYLSLTQLLNTADVISLHVPLLESTHHLIGKKELGLMKKTAFLINTSRGPVIDEAALVQALKQKSIGGAAIDVYEFEPRIHPTLKKLKNVITTPHTASATVATRQAMSRRAAENIIAVLSGKQPANQID